MGLRDALFRRKKVVQTAVPILLLAGAAMAAFGHVVTFDFAYDDFWTIVHNEALDRRLGWVLSKLMAGQGVIAGIPDATRPALVVSFWLERHLFWSWPAGYHFDSLVLYVASCCLATALTFGLTRSRRIALTAGLLFTLAPVHAEAVAAINYREDLLAAIGVLWPLAWLCEPRGKPLEPSSQMAISIVWALGLFGKESAVVLIPLSLVTVASIPQVRSRWRKNEGALFALGGTFVVWINWRVALFLGGDDVPRAPRAPFVSTLLSTARFETHAVVQSLWPLSWAPEYPKEGPAAWGSGVIVALLVAGVVVLGRHRVARIPALGIAWAALAALPASPLVGPVNPRADRYLFLSVLGGALVWAWAADRLWRRFLATSRRGMVAALSIALALALSLVVLCRRAVAPWHDELTLWSVAVDGAPRSPRAWTGLSRGLRLHGDLTGAERAVDEALRLDRAFVPAQVTRIYTLLARGEPELAHIELERLRSEGNGSYRGVSRAARCARLEAALARACIDTGP